MIGLSRLHHVFATSKWTPIQWPIHLGRRHTFAIQQHNACGGVYSNSKYTLGLLLKFELFRYWIVAHMLPELSSVQFSRSPLEGMVERRTYMCRCPVSHEWRMTSTPRIQCLALNPIQLKIVDGGDGELLTIIDFQSVRLFKGVLGSVFYLCWAEIKKFCTNNRTTVSETLTFTMRSIFLFWSKTFICKRQHNSLVLESLLWEAHWGVDIFNTMFHSVQ